MVTIERFYTADYSDEEYYEKQCQAVDWFKEGKEPCFSSGICGALTAGYGRLDYYGYWEYPLPVDQETMKVKV